MLMLEGLAREPTMFKERAMITTCSSQNLLKWHYLNVSLHWLIIKEESLFSRKQRRKLIESNHAFDNLIVDLAYNVAVKTSCF